MRQKVKITAAVLCSLLLTAASYAQTVTQSTHGAIIDASAIPHTMERKPSGTDGTNTALGSNRTGNIGSAVNNDKVYRKFEVYKDNLDPEGSGNGANWLAAVQACRNLSADGGKWRLPTQRELLLMWVLRPELTKAGVFFSNRSYWAATEFEDITAWLVDMNKGYSGYERKDAYFFVRCVRDL